MGFWGLFDSLTSDAQLHETWHFKFAKRTHAAFNSASSNSPHTPVSTFASLLYCWVNTLLHKPALPARPPCLPCQPRGHPRACQNAHFRNPSRRRPLNAAGELRLRAHQPQAAWPAIEHCLWPSFRMSCAPVFRLTSNITSAIFVLFNLELVVEQTCRRYNSRVIRLSAILISVLYCTLALNSLLSIPKAAPKNRP